MFARSGDNAREVDEIPRSTPKSVDERGMGTANTVRHRNVVSTSAALRRRNVVSTSAALRRRNVVSTGAELRCRNVVSTSTEMNAPVIKMSCFVQGSGDDVLVGILVWS